MEVKESYNGFTEKVSYTIQIKQEDDLDVWEIAECFKSQFPKEVCVITFARVVQVECGMLFVGLKLSKFTKSQNSEQENSK